MDFLTQAQALQEQLIAWRRDIHMHPELAFEETRTSRMVADTLRDMGIEVEVGVGKTGVVAHLGDGNGPRIGIRADMDALPIQEENDVPYASQTPGLMHACGHDAHTAMLLGVARLLNESDLPSGEIRLLFQPAEEQWDDEGLSGASRMINDGALQDLDAVLALHIASDTPTGEVHIGPGFVNASVDDFHATIIGIGAHGAAPHTGIDPIYIQAQVINAIQGIRSRRIHPGEASVITVGSIHGGSATNVIPKEVQLTGTIRAYNEEVREQLHAELERAFTVARAFGGDYTLDITRGYPPLYNDPSVAALIDEIARQRLPAEHIKAGERVMGAEDFSYMTQLAPGAMFRLGAKLDEVHRPHHSPIFDVDEASLPIGVAVLAESAVRLLHEKAN